MKLKDELLALFEANKGIYFSGADLAAKLCVSRAAVWKAVNILRRDGYKIDAPQSKKFHCLMLTISADSCALS